ncbi:MAG TPA: hypothetical protein VJ770_26385 [Stellaceae bacterium]|nr:hypothetical protein [Stellaceae bacterium]
MATLEHLADRDELIRYEPDLESDEFPERYAYFTPDFDTWLAATLAEMGCRHGRNRTPYEQAEQILYDFVIGRRLAYGSAYHPLDPLAYHVWELKTPDLRLFGWFPKRRHFVIVCGELKDNLKKYSDYTPYIQKVISFRNALDLDKPKAVTGVSQNEIL